MIKEEFLLKEGFIKINTHLFSSLYEKDLGRRRKLKFSCVCTPNEVLMLSQTNHFTKEEDLVCIHNWDYDGCLTEEKLLLLLDFFK